MNPETQVKRTYNLQSDTDGVTAFGTRGEVIEIAARVVADWRISGLR
jgi:hypothetical protein